MRMCVKYVHVCIRVSTCVCMWGAGLHSGLRRVPAYLGPCLLSRLMPRPPPVELSSPRVTISTPRRSHGCSVPVCKEKR